MASSLQSNRASPPSSFCTCFKRCHMMCWRAFKWIPVLLILSIIIWSYYAYVIQLCLLTIESVVQKCIYLIVYHFLVIFVFWSYWRTIFAEIRNIPDKFKLPEADLEKLLGAETEDAQRLVLENFAKDLPVVTRTMSGSVRYCHRCVLVKPDRAHHCSICAKCVLKMDHHCPWVNNCVCFHNYKFFLLFLGYALMYCLFIMSTCLPYFIKFWKGEVAQATGAGRYHIVFAFFVALMFAISLGSLFGYHCYLVAHNRTTLDFLQTYRENGRPLGSGRLFRKMLKNMYLEAFRAPMFRGGADKDGFSIGCYYNFKEVFGNKPCLWFMPVFTSVGDGCEFPARREHQMATFTTQDRGYDSMATTPHSFGDGIVYQQPPTDEDAESLLTSDRWDRWDERAQPFDDDLGGSSYDEL